MDDSEKVIEYLKSLPERALFDLLNQVLHFKAEETSFENGDFEIDRMCIAAISYGRFEGKTDEEPYVQFVGQPAPSVSHVDWEQLCEQGKCPRCGVLVISVAKLAVCPVCSEEVECT